MNADERGLRTRSYRRLSAFICGQNGLFSIRPGSPWQKSSRLNACPTRLRKSLQPKGGAGGFACIFGLSRLLPQATRASSSEAVDVTMRALAVLAAILVLVCPSGARAQKAPTDSAAIQFALDRLNTSGAALMIAAHPDDENTALLSWFARRRNVRTGYLSLTRGEGGQNLIGSEQGHLLGLIRTQELLAARRIDGAEQFFTRAVDFGFSKSADETLAKWGRDQVLGDIVYVIRKFRPDVIVLRFSGTPRDGHGHHQSSAILGREAFFAAADPARFPEQLKEVQPWKAKRVVWNTFAFTREQEKEAEAMKDRLEVDLGEYNPLLGYSYSEIAGISRSQHRSQGMGSQERRGSVKNHLVHVAGEKATRDLFDGVDLSAGIPALTEAARSFDPRDPSKTIPLLLKARPAIKDEGKRRELDETVAMCTGLWLDATTDRPMAAVGSKVTITAQAVNRSRVPVELVSIDINSAQNVGQPLAYNTPFTKTVEWTAKPPDSAPLRSEPEHPPVAVRTIYSPCSGRRDRPHPACLEPLCRPRPRRTHAAVCRCATRIAEPRGADAAVPRCRCTHHRSAVASLGRRTNRYRSIIGAGRLVLRTGVTAVCAHARRTGDDGELQCHSAFRRLRCSGESDRNTRRAGAVFWRSDHRLSSYPAANTVSTSRTPARPHRCEGALQTGRLR